MMDGIEAIRQITALQPGQRVIVLTDCAGEGTFFNPVVAWKALHRMMEAPDTKHNPNILSQREKGVLRLLTMGRMDNEIGEELFITPVTARTHINRIIPKLGLRNRVEAALYGLRQGLVSL